MENNTYPDKVYKYRTWSNKYHKRILTHNEVFLSSPELFNDPFDCRIPTNYLSLDTIKKKEEYADGMIDKYKEEILRRGETLEYRKKIYLNDLIENLEGFQRKQEEYLYNVQDNHYGVLSLSELWNNILMWSHYGDFHKGICVGFHEKLMRDSNMFGKGGPVMYSEEFPFLDPFIDFSKDEEKRTFRYFQETHSKAKDWSYEKEYRLGTTFPHKPSISDRTFTIPDEFYSEIVLGVDFPKDDKEELINIARSKSIPIYQAVKVPFKFEIDRIQIA